MNPPLRRFLVCRTDALGDALLALPVAYALHRVHPGNKVSLLVSPAMQTLLAGQPGLDEVWAYAPASEHAGAAGLRHLVADIRRRKPDAALLVFPDRRLSWAVFRAGVKLRVGTGRRWWSWLYSLRVRHSRARGDRHEAEYNLDLVRALGLPAKLEPPCLHVRPAAARWADEFLRGLGLRPNQRLVILHPGTRGSAVDWPAEAYARLARLLLNQTRVRVLVTGSAAEQPLLAKVVAGPKPCPWTLLPAVDLNRFAALIARAQVLVSGSTGPMHLAAALRTPTVSLFPVGNSIGPQRWAPLGNRQILLTPPAGSAGSNLSALAPEAVAQAVRSLWLPGRVPARPRRRRQGAS